jgi:long-chain fatty acid transport protein
VLPLLLILAAPNAFGGGYYFGDSGSEAVSRGGAWVAGADTQFAQLYNPAGLIRIEGPTVNAGISAVYQGIHFERLDRAGNPMDPVSNEAGAFPIPELGFAMPIGSQFAFAFGFYSPFAPDVTYDPNGAQRYLLIDSSIFTFSFGPSMAWQPIPQFTLGLGVSWNVFHAGERLKVSTTLIPNADGTDRPEDDVLVDLNVWDQFTPSFNLGVLIEPVKEVSIGVSFLPATSYKGTGSASLDFTGHGLEAQVNEVVIEDDNVSLSVKLPMILRYGVAVRPWEHTEFELGGDYEQWSLIEEVWVRDIDVEVGLGGATLPVPEEIALPAGFRDSYSVRFGAETHFFKPMSLRAGVSYERSALTTQRVSASLVDTDKVMIGAGAGVNLVKNRLQIDLTGAWMIYEKLEIRDSMVTNINVIDDGLAYVVGNGDLRSHGWVLGGQVSYRFGETRKERTPKSGPVPPGDSEAVDTPPPQ